MMLHKIWHMKLSNVGMEHHSPEDFARCQWQSKDKVHVLWLLYRFVLSTYALITWALSLINYSRPQDRPNKYFIYLTNWSYTFLTAQFLLAFGISIHKFIMERKKFNQGTALTQMPVVYKIYWTLHTISLPSAFVVTSIFWGVVFNPERNPIDVINITTHGLNSLIMLTDFWLVAHPYRLIHFYWPLSYAACYCVFTIIYYFCGGTDVYDRPFIYEILDWSKPEKATIWIAVACVALLVVHLFFWALFKLKQWLRNRCWSKTAGKYAEGEENLGMDATMKSHIATLSV